VTAAVPWETAAPFHHQSSSSSKGPGIAARACPQGIRNTLKAHGPLRHSCFAN